MAAFDIERFAAGPLTLVRRSFLEHGGHDEISIVVGEEDRWIDEEDPADIALLTEACRALGLDAVDPDGMVAALRDWARARA